MPRRIFLFAGFILLVLVFEFAIDICAAPAGFGMQELDLGAPVKAVAWGDIDKDGDDDLVVITVKVENKDYVRRLHLYWNKGKAGFSKDAAELAVPDNACCFTVADLHPAAGDEVVFLMPDGLHAYRWEKDSFKGPDKLYEKKLFFRFPAPKSLPVWDFVRDFNNDGKDDILVPVEKGFEVLLNVSDKVLSSSSLIPARTHETYPSAAGEREFRNRFFTVRFWKRMPYIVDENGDGRLDVVILRKLKLVVHRQDKDGKFSSKPTREQHLYFLDKAWSTGSRLENVQFIFEDINDDRRVDIIYTHVLGEFGVFSSNKTEQSIFFQKKDGSFPKHTPDQKVNVPGISILPQLVDFDGDGDKDFLVSSLRTDVLSKLTSVVRSNMKISYFVYFFDKPKQVFSVSPDVTKTVSVPLAAVEQLGTVPFAYFTGDFDGDGRKDLLTMGQANQIAVYQGTYVKPWFGDPYYSFAKKPMLKAKVKTSNWVKLVDLNKDGRTDVVLTYPFAQKHKNLVSIVYSK
ncbi:MAG: VCBS repeat-containing protein [Planctomycetota bacterium]|nr:MAG: VCBS repeat-containing protein [Planctomycetota bacterium]